MRAQLGLASHFLNLPKKGGLQHFFCLGNEAPLATRHRALHIYVFKRAFDDFRHNNFQGDLVKLYRYHLLNFLSEFPHLKDPVINLTVNDDVYVLCLF